MPLEQLELALVVRHQQVLQEQVVAQEESAVQELQEPHLHVAQHSDHGLQEHGLDKRLQLAQEHA